MIAEYLVTYYESNRIDYPFNYSNFLINLLCKVELRMSHGKNRTKGHDSHDFHIILFKTNNFII